MKFLICVLLFGYSFCQVSNDKYEVVVDLLINDSKILEELKYLDYDGSKLKHNEKGELQITIATHDRLSENLKFNISNYSTDKDAEFIAYLSAKEDVLLCTVSFLQRQDIKDYRYNTESGPVVEFKFFFNSNNEIKDYEVKKRSTWRGAPQK